MAGKSLFVEPLEPVGFLSSVIPGPVYYDGFTSSETSTNLTDRSRLCEIVWLEPALFRLADKETIYAVDEEWYKTRHDLALLEQTGVGDFPHISSWPGPGSLGEQLCFRDVQHRHLTRGSQILIGDALMEIVQLIPAPQGLPTAFYAYELRFLEEGLAEPGSPLILR